MGYGSYGRERTFRRKKSIGFKSDAKNTRERRKVEKKERSKRKQREGNKN